MECWSNGVVEWWSSEVGPCSPAALQRSYTGGQRQIYLRRNAMNCTVHRKAFHSVLHGNALHSELYNIVMQCTMHCKLRVEKEGEPKCASETIFSRKEC